MKMDLFNNIKKIVRGLLRPRYKHSISHEEKISSVKKASVGKDSQADLFKRGFNLSLRNIGSGKTFHKVDQLMLKVFLILAVILFILSFFFIGEFTIGWFLFFLSVMTIIVPLVLYLLSFFIIRLIAQYIMYKRKKEIEYHLPELLQLTAANMNAGMMLESALFNAAKPHFGVLWKEMEIVAKDTLAGKSIDDALIDLAKKYDSGILERTVNIILEGMRSGSRMGDLLNKISINIQELRIMKKEMSASVMSYVIFITVAAIAAAPVLMGLSHELLVVVKEIMSTISLDTTSTSSTFSLSFNVDAISIKDFRIFTFVNIFFTSLFSALIVSSITKGSIKDSIKIIPIYIAVATVIFILSFKFLHMLMGNFF